MEFREEEWDVLLYVASHISVCRELPTCKSLVDSGIQSSTIGDLVARDLLQEKKGKLQPTNRVLQVTAELSRSRGNGFRQMH